MLHLLQNLGNNHTGYNHSWVQLQYSITYMSILLLSGRKYRFFPLVLLSCFLDEISRFFNFQKQTKFTVNSI